MPATAATPRRPSAPPPGPGWPTVSACPAGTDDQALATAVAAHTGRGLDEVSALIDPSRRTTRPTTATWATWLDGSTELDREVSHP